MTPKEIVREHYPQAVVQHHPAGYQLGQSTPITEECWAVYPAHGLGYAPIGQGATSAEAWHNAAEAVKKEKRSLQAQRWVDYLLRQGFEWSKEDRLVLIHPNDGELKATMNPQTGHFMASPKLAEHLAAVTDQDSGPSGHTLGFRDSTNDPTLRNLKQIATKGGEHGPLYDQGVLSVVKQIERDGYYRRCGIATLILFLKIQQSVSSPLLTNDEEKEARQFMASQGWTIEQAMQYASGIDLAERLLFIYKRDRENEV